MEDCSASFFYTHKNLVSRTLIEILSTHPTANLSELCFRLSWKFHRVCTRQTASRLLKQMGWSWRIPTRVQVKKFRRDNVQRYAHYVDCIQDIDWSKLKFADEAHVVSRSLAKKKVLGVVGNRTWVTTDDLHGRSFSVTLLTTFNREQPIIFDIREESNTQWDFLKFVLFCVNHGHLVEGDYLIIDNAPVHGALSSLEFLVNTLTDHGVKLIFLPKYSPELNPCELVFNLMKHHIRYHRNPHLPLWLEVINGLAKVNISSLVQFYDKCISLDKLVK